VLSLIDHATDMVWAFPLPDKESTTVKAVMESWRAKVERQANRELVTLRSDLGTEFEGAVGDWVKELGISRQKSAPYTHSRMARWSGGRGPWQRASGR